MVVINGKEVHGSKGWVFALRDTPPQAGFSPAAGQKNGRSNRKRNFEKANIE